MQLYHRKSQRFLAVVPKTTADMEKGALKVSCQSGDEWCQFKILPKFRFRTEGESVYSDDQIALSSTKISKHFLHISSKAFPVPVLLHEMNCAYVAEETELPPSVAMRIKLFHSHAHAVQPNTIMPGSVVRLHHPGKRAFLSASVRPEVVASPGQGGAADDGIVPGTVFVKEFMELDSGLVRGRDSKSLWIIEARKSLYNLPLFDRVTFFVYSAA